MALRLLRPLCVDDENGELAYASYKPWHETVWYAVTPSQYMFLSLNIELFENGEISEAQALTNEFQFTMRAWGQIG